MRVINISDLDPSWCWLKGEFKNTKQEWMHYSNQSLSLPKIIPKKESITRLIAATQAIKQAKGRALLVSHGPRPAMYVGNLARILRPDLPHLAYSFNFTHLPRGAQRGLMARAYQQPIKLVTYSTVERELYANYFDIPIERIDMLHWAVHAPKIDLSQQPIEAAGRYICALGSQGRDYQTLFMAMQKLPNIKLVVVASPDSIKDLVVPDNVKVHTNIPLAQAHNILAHSQFMVLPLRDSQVPCGHVTIVSGMFFKKAILVTNSLGVHDYITNEKTGLFFEPKNPNDLAQKIESLWDDAALAKTLSETGFKFANTHCTEKTVINYFTHFIQQFN